MHVPVRESDESTIMLRIRSALLRPFINISGGISIFGSGACEREQSLERTRGAICVCRKRYPGVESGPSVGMLDTIFRKPGNCRFNLAEHSQDTLTDDDVENLAPALPRLNYYSL